MRAGPKGSIDVAPLSFVGWPRDRAKPRERFIREHSVVHRGHGAGKRVRLRHADLTLKLARRMVELNPASRNGCTSTATGCIHPSNDATLLPLLAEPGALHGHNPTLLIVGELHVVTREVWEAATTAAGKRAESLTLAISTPSNCGHGGVGANAARPRRRRPGVLADRVRRPGRLRGGRPRRLAHREPGAGVP